MVYIFGGGEVGFTNCHPLAGNEEKIRGLVGHRGLAYEGQTLPMPSA
jgi:hypothetical protein